MTPYYATRVKVMANAPLRAGRSAGGVDRSAPDLPPLTTGSRSGPGDIAVTADIPLAARCLAKGAIALSPKGLFFTDNDIGEALGMRGLMDDLRQSSVLTGGPAPMTPKDCSRFVSKLDEAVNAVRRAHPTRES